MGALAAARDQARVARLRDRHRALQHELEDIEAVLDELGEPVPAPATDVDQLIDQWADARRRVERLEQRNAELDEAARRARADLRAARDERDRMRTEPAADVEPLRARVAELQAVMLAGNGPLYHAWCRRLAIEQGRELARLHAAGVSGPELARRFNLSSTICYQRMKLAGYHARPVRGHEAAQRRAEARAMVADGMTHAEVAAQFHVSRRAVGKWLVHAERPAPVAKPKRKPCRRDGCPLAAGAERAA